MQKGKKGDGVLRRKTATGRRKNTAVPWLPELTGRPGLKGTTPDARKKKPEKRTEGDNPECGPTSRKKRGGKTASNPDRERKQKGVPRGQRAN